MRVQSDFYFRWAQNRIQATFTADQTLTSLIEYVGVDTTSNIVEIELPDSSGTDVINGKKIWIIDQGNATTNNITVIPNSLDSTTIEGQTSYVISDDSAIMIFELVEDQWVIIGNTKPFAIIGTMGFINNEDVTTISNIGEYVDINGTFTNGILKNFTRSGDTLTYTGFKAVKAKFLLSLTVIRDSGAAPRDIEAALFIDGVNIGAAPITMTGSLLNFSFNGITPVSPTDDVKVQIRNNQDGADIVVRTLNLTATYVNDV